jgi:hypothetical protein
MVSNLVQIESQYQTFVLFNLVSGIGYLTAACQDIVVIRLMNNVRMNFGAQFLQIGIFATSVLLFL